jgi:hypothetical protein
VSCKHDFGIIEIFSKAKDYDNLDEFGVFSYTYINAVKAYNCATIDDDALNGWWPRIGSMKSYFHTYSRPGTGIARHGVTLIPPESLELFYAIVRDDTTPEFSEQAAAVLTVIAKAKRDGKFIIHFGV